jgi:hypothetical protein
MPQFVVIYHFAADHRVRQGIVAESLSDARSRVLESLRGDDPFRFFEARNGDSLFVVPLAGLRCIEIVEAERGRTNREWDLGDRLAGA